MSFVRCSCGRSHWGPHGAAGLLLTDVDRTRVLLQLRSRRVLNPGTWALPGGALERGEDATAAALRETREEVGIDVADVTATGTVAGLVHPQWSYTYVLAVTTTDVVPPATSWEVERHEWVALEDVATTPRLHPNLARDWPGLLRALDTDR